MAIQLQNQGVAGKAFTAIRHYHSGGNPQAEVSRFSSAPAPKVEDRTGRCAGVTKSGKSCNAFHTTTSKFCVNHEEVEVTDESADDS